MTWDEATRHHRMMRVAYAIQREETGADQHARWLVSDLVVQELTVEERQLLEAIDLWHEEGGAGGPQARARAGEVRSRLGPVVASYTRGGAERGARPWSASSRPPGGSRNPKSGSHARGSLDQVELGGHLQGEFEDPLGDGGRVVVWRNPRQER